MLSSVLGNSFLKPYSHQKLASVETQFFPVTSECHTNWARGLCFLRLILYGPVIPACTVLGTQAGMGLSGSDVSSQARSYQSWRCSWHPEWYHLSPVALSVCRASWLFPCSRWLFPCSRQPRPAERPPEPSGQLGLKREPSPAADMTMSLAGRASVWDVEGSVPLGLSWGRVTQGCFLCTFSLMDSERWAPPECDYRNNCLMLLLWLILKSSLSVSVDYFGSLAIHISPKNSFCWMTKETGS